MSLPTSDESEELLRVRHSVSAAYPPHLCVVACSEPEFMCALAKWPLSLGVDAAVLPAQASHIMAMALQKLFPDAQTTIGPWIERGFYYDFDLSTPLTPADLKAVKKEMVKIIKADLPFICEEVGLLSVFFCQVVVHPDCSTQQHAASCHAGVMHKCTWSNSCFRWRR